MTRRNIIAAALAAPAALAAGTIAEPDILSKANSLLFSMAPTYRKTYEQMTIGVLHAHFEEHPFPVPRWLADHEHWQWLEGISREEAEGVYCEKHAEGNGIAPIRCTTCGAYRSATDPIHWAVVNVKGKKTTTGHCPDCCPACQKRALIS